MCGLHRGQDPNALIGVQIDIEARWRIRQRALFKIHNDRTYYLAYCALHSAFHPGGTAGRFVGGAVWKFISTVPEGFTF